MRSAIYYGLQPLLLAVVFWLACTHTIDVTLTALVLVAVQLVLFTCEHFYPANTAWQVTGNEKLQHLGFFVLYSLSAAAILQLYNTQLAPSLEQLRQSLGIAFWPHAWPMAARIVLSLACSEFIWYWFHRFEHSYAWAWRVSSHGVHHSFKKLNALNFNTNHPLEALVISLPALLVAFLFGAGNDTQAAMLLIIANTSCAHANLKLNSRVIGLFFTTNEWHFRHHSIVMRESNTNYGCMLIIWDRLFGTFEPGLPQELGIGHREPSFKEKMWMPLREPAGSEIAPT